MNESEVFNNKSNIFHNKWVVCIVVFITALLFIISFIPGTGNWIENEYLVTAAAIIPLLYTTVAQHIELGYQRKELNQSTQALQGQQQELNETKKINDKHQINNQFFQLLSMRESFIHSNDGKKQTERLSRIVDSYDNISNSFRKVTIKKYLGTFSDLEKVILYDSLAKDYGWNREDEEKVELLLILINRLVSYYDDTIKSFEWPPHQMLYDEEIIESFIFALKKFIDNEDYISYWESQLRFITLEIEEVYGISSKHFAYHKSITIFLNEIKDVELQNRLGRMYLDILTESERFYFGVKLMKRPISTYIFNRSTDREERDKSYRENILEVV